MFYYLRLFHEKLVRTNKWRDRYQQQHLYMHRQWILYLYSSKPILEDDLISITRPKSSDERHNMDNCRDDGRTNNDDESDKLIVPASSTDVIHELESSSSMLLEIEEIEDELRGFFWPENRE